MFRMHGTQCHLIFVYAVYITAKIRGGFVIHMRCLVVRRARLTGEKCDISWSTFPWEVHNRKVLKSGS